MCAKVYFIIYVKLCFAFDLFSAVFYRLRSYTSLAKIFCYQYFSFDKLTKFSIIQLLLASAY